MRSVIGMDIGGHNVRSALCDEEGNILLRRSALIDRQASSAESNVRIADDELHAILEEASLKASDLACVAVGVPGLTDVEKGIVVSAPNLPFWHDLPLRERLEARISASVVLDNDVNMAALGEYWKGAARDCTSFFFLALGTGIGGGVFLDGRLYRGPRYAAGEVGYLVLHPRQKERRMGDLGWVESVASGLAIQERGKEAARRHPGSPLARLAEKNEAIAASHVFDAAEEGDAEARKILEEVTDCLALTVVNVTAILDPEMIVFGGGVSSQGPRLLGPIRDKAQGYGLEIPRLLQSALREDAQLWGAVYTALTHGGGPAGSPRS